MEGEDQSGGPRSARVFWREFPWSFVKTLNIVYSDLGFIILAKKVITGGGGRSRGLGSVRVLLSRISFVAARRLPRLPGRQTSNSPRHNQLSQSSKCKTNTSLQTFNKGRNTGWWFIERCKMKREYSLPQPTYETLALVCNCFGKIVSPVIAY